MKPLVFTMEPTAFTVRYAQNNLYVKCRLVLLFKEPCEGSGCWSSASHCTGPGSILRPSNMRFVVNEIVLGQVSLQFVDKPTRCNTSYE